MSSVARTFWRHLKVQESSERHLSTLKITGDITNSSVNKKRHIKITISRQNMGSDLYKFYVTTLEGSQR